MPFEAEKAVAASFEKIKKRCHAYDYEKVSYGCREGSFCPDL
jgi:hypothetical protein